MQILKVGNKVINLEHVTSIKFDIPLLMNIYTISTHLL